MTAEVRLPVIITRECSRCGGSGHYSFNLRDGTRCYGCGGSGRVPCAPKGQKKIPTTANGLKEARVGDIISSNCVLYQVVRIKWTSFQSKGFDCFNQQVTVTRLIDGKTMYMKRGVTVPDWENFNSGKSYCVVDGVKEPSRVYVEPTPEMIGQIVDEVILQHDVVEEINGVAIVKVEEKYALRMRNEDGFFVYVPGYTKEYVKQRAASKVLKELTSGTDEQETGA